VFHPWHNAHYFFVSHAQDDIDSALTILANASASEPSRVTAIMSLARLLPEEEDVPAVTLERLITAALDIADHACGNEVLSATGSLLFHVLNLVHDSVSESPDDLLEPVLSAALVHRLVSSLKPFAVLGDDDVAHGDKKYRSSTHEEGGECDAAPGDESEEGDSDSIRRTVLR
jgi:hypothetical protein